MRIERVEWARYRVPFVHPFATAHEVLTHREGFLVRLITVDGLVGLGEAAPLPAFGGGTLAQAEADLLDVLPRLPGRSAPEAEALIAVWSATLVARCALDIAICDLQAQGAGLPLSTWLQGGSADSHLKHVPVNATIGASALDQAIAAAQRAVRAGFTCIKLKVGVVDDEAEIRRIAAVSAAMGPHVRLRLDANGAWTEAQAVYILTTVAEMGVALELVEQPVAAGTGDGAAESLALLARVRAAVAVRIAADEAVSGPESAEAIIAANAADVLVVKPMMAGGLRAAREVIRLAGHAGLTAIVTTTLDTGVGIAAALQLAATLADPVPACGLATAQLLEADLLASPLALQQGEMAVPEAPGLGVTLDPAKLARYASPWQTVAA